jgi:hypothetical protein
MVGAAIATIVWSIDIIATAKIMAIRTRYRLVPMNTSSGPKERAYPVAPSSRVKGSLRTLGARRTAVCIAG